jgi:type IV secretory pathway TraG/TraD family ATPase VirD4
VAISIKRDLIDVTGGWRQRKGKVQIYDPAGATGFPTLKWSPHYECNDFETAWRYGNAYSSDIGPRGHSRGDSDWGHWRDAAQRLVAVAFYAGARLNAPIAQVRAWVDDSSGQSLHDALIAVQDADPIAFEVFQSIQNRPEIERGSCYSSAQRVLSIFMERKVAESASGFEFDPADFLLEGENTLYVSAPLHQMGRLQALFVGLIENILQAAAEIAQASPSGRLPRPLLMMLDECANVAPIDVMPNYLATGNSQGISMIAIFNDLAQVRDRYGELAETIVNNSRAKLFLSGISDLSTLELASELIGEGRCRSFTHNMGGDASEYSYGYRSLVASDVARQLRPGHGLLIYHYLRPMSLGLRPWFRSHILRQRAKLPFSPHIRSSTATKTTIPLPAIT